MAKKKIRMLKDHLVDGIQYKCDDVVNVNDRLAKTLIDAGCADGDKDAVKHCMNVLGSQIIQHGGVADEPPADEPPADEPPADEPPADEPPADEPPAE